MSVETSGYLSALVVGQAAMLAVLLAADPRERRTHSWLVVTLLAIALNGADDLLQLPTLRSISGPILPLTSAAFFVIGPGLLGYTRATTGANQGRPLSAWHFVPAVLVAALQIADLTVFKDQVVTTTPRAELVAQLLYAIHPGGYFALVYVRVRRSQRALRDEVSTLDGRTLNWLLVTVGLFSMVLLAWVGSAYWGDLTSGTIATALTSVGLAALGVNGVRQRHVRSGLPGPLNRVPNDAVGADPSTGESHQLKYARSALPSEAALALRSRLEEVIRIKRPYLSMDLTLGDLAREVNTTPHQLSQLLSQHLAVTFYDYVNHHRIEAVKARLAKGEAAGQTLLEIAFASGFGSKSTFNDTFRRFTGMSPSEYRRRAESEPASS